MSSVRCAAVVSGTWAPIWTAGPAICVGVLIIPTGGLGGTAGLAAEEAGPVSAKGVVGNVKVLAAEGLVGLATGLVGPAAATGLSCGTGRLRARIRGLMVARFTGTS